MKPDLTMGYLIQALKERGIINAKTPNGAKQTLASWFRNGRLVLRMRPVTGWRVVNEDEIAEIIKAFSPGGVGTWHYHA